MNDTIYAVATGAGRAAICVVRVSGPRVRNIAEALIVRVPTPRHAAYVRVRDPVSGETLDRAVALFFEASSSELGEDGLELHLHGSPAVVLAVLAALNDQPGTRQAEPGEFARRAFANGKMDLAQIEGLADLIGADTAAQRRQAQRQMSGALRLAVEPFRAALVAAAAETEAAIDFAEETGNDAVLHAAVVARTSPVRVGLRQELERPPSAERIRDGVRIVIAGPPNVGKSTLLNALARRNAAIVSPVAGTTRDPIEVHLDLAGVPVTLTDTAGLRETADDVERIGVALATQRAEEADLVLWLGDAAPPTAAPVWRIATKLDLLEQRRRTYDAADVLPLSAKTGENLDVLDARLLAFAAGFASSAGSGLLARARHREAFAAALAALDRIALDPHMAPEVIAEDLRAACFALDRLIGRVDVEDILGAIFSRFCIGK